MQRLRNFSIIAHIDHGKSTLSDRLLERAGNVDAVTASSAQVLDTLQVERERGITVKAQSASMIVNHWHDAGGGRGGDADGEGGEDLFLLNLIDTPGHVDFSYEVTRSLAACQGALLLVDASQGVQAQTLTTYYSAKELGLKIIPVITKTDLPHARPEDAALALASLLDIDPDEVIFCSAKTGEGVDEIMPAVIERIPPPTGERDGALRARIIDSWYDEHRGCICLVQVADGTLAEGDRIAMRSRVPDEAAAAAGARGGGSAMTHTVQECGLLMPSQVRTGKLLAGQVGYVIAGLRSTREARLGDTMFVPPDFPAPLPGFVPAKSMVFASVYPVDSSDFDTLQLAVDRLTLNDASVSVTRENNMALGSGLRCGFLGFLHMEVFRQRLQDEFGMPVIVTAPQVPLELRRMDKQLEGDDVLVVTNTAEWPTDGLGKMKYTVLEPMVEVTVIAPQDCVGPLMTLMLERRGTQVESSYLEDERVLQRFHVPWSEVVSDMHDVVKNLSAGYASFNYREIEPRAADLVKVDMVLNDEAVDALSIIVHRSEAERRGRVVAKRLKTEIRRQQYEIVIQARVGNKVVARERIAPFRKDVLTKSGKTVGGGDKTRKQKLLAKQKAGKKRMKRVGRVEIPQSAFWSILGR